MVQRQSYITGIPNHQLYLLKTILYNYMCSYICVSQTFFTVCVILVHCTLQVPSFPQWFNIIYDSDESVYTAKLGEEYRAGDVIISEQQQ